VSRQIGFWRRYITTDKLKALGFTVNIADTLNILAKVVGNNILARMHCTAKANQIRLTRRHLLLVLRLHDERLLFVGQP